MRNHVCSAAPCLHIPAYRTRPSSRSRTLIEPTAHSPALAAASRELYLLLGLQRARIGALSLRADGLASAEHAHHQLLLGDADDRARRIEAAADATRAKFGPHVIRPAVLAAPPAPAPRARPVR